MKNRYKKRDIIVEPNKNSPAPDNNIVYSSDLNLKRAKSPINGAKNQGNIKPVLNRFNRLYQQKENKIIKEESQNNREAQIKKLSQTNEKEQKNKNLYKFTRYNINLNSFISTDGASTNLNDTKRSYINKDNDKDKDKEYVEKNDNKINLEKNINNNNFKINNINLSKLISYNSKVRNLNKYIKKSDDKNKLKEEVNQKKIEENNNKKENTNEDIINMKNIIIKRKYNYSKLIDKIKKNNNLIQANKNKNKFITKDAQETNINDNENNKQHKDILDNNLNDEDIPKIKVNNSNRKYNSENPIESPKENGDKNNNEEKSVKDNVSEASSFIHSRFINLNIKQKQSFQFLVHQASKSRDLSNSFHKYYESNRIISNFPSRAPSEKDDCSINTNTDDQSAEKHKFRNFSLLRNYKFNEGDSFSSLNTNVNENKYNSLTDRKIENRIYNKNDLNNIKILNFNYNKKQNNNNNDNDDNNNNDTINKSSVITNNIINNNVYNTTLNFYRINNICKSKLNFPKSKALSSKNLMENDEIIYEDETNMDNINSNRNNLNNNIITNNNINENLINNNYQPNQKEYGNFTVISSSTNSSAYLPLINLELIYSLENILKILLNKINKYQICDKECLNYIMFFFDNGLYNEEIKIFKNKHNKNNFLYNIKIEILCFFLCYDISFSKNFNQAAILLKTIFNIIHSNFLIFIEYIIYLYQLNTNIDDNNYNIINKLQIIVSNELKIHLIKQDMNEFNILQIITNNSKNLNNYYKMLIDNLYGQNYISDDITIKFPQCIDNKNNIMSQNKIQNIISAFFFDAYRLLTNYNFNDLFEFFNIFLNKKQYENEIVCDQNDNLYENDNDYNAYNNIIIQNNNNSKNKIVKYLLPKIKKYYKYSLVLDLDETLICIKRDSNNNVKLNKNNLIALILRPGLIDFLHKMKQIYELILFSSGTSEYVSPIVKSIEKKEKFFEHILYRQHVTYDDNGNFFKNLNLLNRNVKNILIVDDTYKNFKNHKLNGISIKPFYGDVYNDKNTLRILGSILYKIRYDADITGDIRISLSKEKNSKLYSQIANNL